MKKVLKYLFAITLFISFNVVFASTFEIMNGSCGSADNAYKYYRMFDKIGESGTQQEYKVTENWKKFFTEGAGKDLVTLDENGIALDFSDIHTVQIAKSAYKYVEDNNIEPEYNPVIECQADGNVKYDIEVEGYYYIKSPRGRLGIFVDPETLSAIYEKNFDPFLDLSFDDGKNLKYAAIGDEINYVAELSIVDGAINYYLEIIGTPGIDLSDFEFDEEDLDYPILNQDYVLVTEDLKDENAVVGIKFNQSYLDGLESGRPLTLFFKGKVNSDVSSSNNSQEKVNNVTVVWHYGENQVKQDSISLISWKYSINTYYNKNSNPIDVPNVRYVLSKTNDVNSTDLYKFVKLSDGEYRLATEDDTNTTTVLVNTSGKNITINGLNIGTYYLIQKSVPFGYNPVTGPVTMKLEIADDESNGHHLVADSMNVVLELKSVILPGTGGVGTTLLMSISLLMFVLTLSLIITKMREQNN